MARRPAPSEDAAGAPEPGEKVSTEKAEAGSARTKSLVTGAAIGIGSAALVAALLYANRARRTDKSG